MMEHQIKRKLKYLVHALIQLESTKIELEHALIVQLECTPIECEHTLIELVCALIELMCALID